MRAVRILKLIDYSCVQLKVAAVDVQSELVAACSIAIDRIKECRLEIELQRLLLVDIDSKIKCKLTRKVIKSVRD